MVFGKTIMKRFCMLVALAMVTVTPGYAAPPGDLELMVSSGVVFPESPMTFRGYWTMQYGAGIGVGIPLSPSVTFVGSFEYYSFKLNEDGVSEDFDPEYAREIWAFNDVTLIPAAVPSSVTAISANMRVAPVLTNGPLSPYFLVGIGAMRFSLSEISMPMTSRLVLDNSAVSMTAATRITGGTQTAVLLQGGVGLDIRLSSLLNVFIEARFVRGLTEGLGAAYVPLTAGVKLQL
jgi:opacity protein-like surface antigen